MKKIFTDWKLLLSLILIFFVIYISFEYKSQVFWYLYTASMLLAMGIAIMNETMDNEKSTDQNIYLGFFSGILLYGIVFIGYKLLPFLPQSYMKELTKLYDLFSPEWFWQYIALIFIIAPGEELFWRGFVFKRLLGRVSKILALFLAAIFNAGAYVLTGYSLLVVAGFVSGLFWGTLYLWKKSMPLLVISHIIFSLLLLAIFPLS